MASLSGCRRWRTDAEESLRLIGGEAVGSPHQRVCPILLSTLGMTYFM